MSKGSLPSLADFVAPFLRLHHGVEHKKGFVQWSMKRTTCSVFSYGTGKKNTRKVRNRTVPAEGVCSARNHLDRAAVRASQTSLVVKEPGKANGRTCHKGCIVIL